MNLALFYDTETTGLPLFSEPSEDPRQPHMVQLAVLLVDMDTRKERASLDLIIKPEGWEVPADGAAIHGITTEMAHDLGVPEKAAVEMLLEMWRGERLRIGHNEQFDARIVRIGTMRYAPLFADPWKAGKAECTARMATPICAIPPTEKMRAAKRFHHKTPNLGEAYAHFCGANLQDAHSALADARACSRIYFAMRAPKSDHGADSPLETTHE